MSRRTRPIRPFAVAVALSSLVATAIHAGPLRIDRQFGSIDGTLLANDGSVETPIQGAEETPTDLRSPVPFSIDFFGTVYDTLFINENGIISFGAPLPGTPGTVTDLANGGIPFIAPFFADADMAAPLFVGTDLNGNPYSTDGGVGLAFTYGVNMFINMTSAYQGSTDVPTLTNTLQTAFYGSTTSTDFRLDFNYSEVQWESGNSDGGVDGLGGTGPIIGFSNGHGLLWEAPGSGGTSSGAFLSNNGGAEACALAPLSVTCTNYSFLFRDGVPYYFADGAPVFPPVPVPEPATLGLLALGLGLIGVRKAVLRS
jgi:hypothetical protein